MKVSRRGYVSSFIRCQGIVRYGKTLRFPRVVGEPPNALRLHLAISCFSSAGDMLPGIPSFFIQQERNKGSMHLLCSLVDTYL